MGVQLEMEFDQSDEFYRCKAEYEQAITDEKNLKSLINKFAMFINSEIREKQVRMQATCTHPNKYVQESFDPHKREDEFTEYCEDCGKMLRAW